MTAPQTDGRTAGEHAFDRSGLKSSRGWDGDRNQEGDQDLRHRHRPVAHASRATGRVGEAVTGAGAFTLTRSESSPPSRPSCCSDRGREGWYRADDLAGMHRGVRRDPAEAGGGLRNYRRIQRQLPHPGAEVDAPGTSLALPRAGGGAMSAECSGGAGAADRVSSGPMWLGPLCGVVSDDHVARRYSPGERGFR
jgi:hypothetical protein